MKADRRVKRVTAHLDVFQFPAASVNPVAPLCLHCSSPLTVHQPDKRSPERMIGVCERCRYWYLIDIHIDLSEGVMVRLPDTEIIRELSRENPSDGISLMGHEPDPEPGFPPRPFDGPGRSN